MLISQLVQANENLTVVNDVQLGWYPDKADKPTNAELAKAYMWTSEHVGTSLSSLDLLDRLRLSYLTLHPTNRFVTLAFYGRGKSHLGLALANYFGQPSDSPIVGDLLRNIGAPSVAPERAANFRDFKQRRGAFLVVRISGDEAGSLNQQFIAGLEKALSEHPATQNARLPFWYPVAQSVLENLNAEETQRAESALAAHELGVAQLFSLVKDRIAVHNGTNVHDLCVDAVRAAKGVDPHFGGEVSLQTVVEWAGDEFCAVDPEAGKPCGGLLILFDEFVRFVERYARNPRGDSLQKLLDGVKNRPGVAAFMAFAQIDPDQAAENVAALGGTPLSLQSLKTELGRLPQGDRYTLHTSLESVLNVYLEQDSALWAAQMQKPAWMKAVNDATDDTMALFPRRYDGGARWNAETVQEIITKGCFPLHPITAALLADVNLQANTAGSRSVMSFVRQVLKEREGQPVEQGNAPNWIYATEIVRVFGGMVNRINEYSQYDNTLSRVGNEVTEMQTAILGAMLLHDVTNLKPKDVGGYAALVALLSGYGESECQSTLQAMTNAGYIRYDEAGKRWTFPPMGEDDRPIEIELSRRTAEATLDAATLTGLREAWKESHLAPHKADRFNLDWGNADDWAAAPLLFTRETFTAANLKKAIERPQTDMFSGLKLPPRGYVVHLLAAHDDDVPHFRAQAAEVLDEALKGQNSPPVVVCLPREAQPHFPRLILKRRAIAGFLDGDRKDFGAGAVKVVEAKYETDLKTALEKLLDGADAFEVPQPYRNAVNTAFAASGASLSLALRECYNQAYANRPPSLLPHYALSKSHPYRKGIKTIAEKLVTDAVGSLEAGMAPGPGKDLVFSGPRPLIKDWNLLAGQGYGVQPPSGRAKAGWEVLDKAFDQGKGAAPLSRVIEKLLGPPYGYDAAGLTLLLAAWYGRHARLLSVTAGNTPVSMDTFWDGLDKPWDFLCNVSKRGVAWSRQDIGKDEQAANEIIERVQTGQPLGSEEAQNFEARLRVFSEDERQTNQPLRTQANDIADRLKRDLATAKNYDEAADSIENKILSARGVGEVAVQARAVGDLPSPGLVPPAQPDASKLAERARAKMESLVEAECVRWEKLSSLTDYKHHVEQLREVEGELKKAHRDDLTSRVQAAQTTLEARRNELETRGHDAAIVAEVRAMEQLTMLKAWRDALARLDALTPRAAETREFIEAARAGLQARIQTQTEWAQGLSSQVEALHSAVAAQELRDEVQLRRGDFNDTPEAAHLQDVWTRSGQLQATWDAIGAVERRLSAAVQSGPDEVARWQARLDEIEGGDAASLNDAARNRLGTLRREMTAARERAQSEAVRFLETRRDTLHSGDIQQLRRDLRALPAWLPQPAHAGWEALRQQVQARLDEDEVGSIVARFRVICDPIRRAACLQALQSLQTELESASGARVNGAAQPKDEGRAPSGQEMKDEMPTASSVNAASGATL